MPSDGGHADRDDQTHSPTKEARDGVPNDRRRGPVRPGALPDDGTPGNDGQACQDEHDDSNVLDAGPEISRHEDDDEAEPTEGELEKDRVKSGPAKGANDERSETRDGAVHGVSEHISQEQQRRGKDLRRRHHNKDEISLDIQQRLLELRRLDLRAPHPRLARPQPLHGRHLFLRRQKPRRHRRARKRKTPQPKQERQPARQQINILPRLEPTPLNLRESVVERPADDGKQPSAAKPPALAQRLLLLRVEARDDAHEARGDDALDEAEEKALHVEALVRHDAGRRHADGGPDDDDGAEDAAKVEALQSKGHGVQAGEHAKVEEGRRPREARGVDGGGRGGTVRHGELEVACHAEEDGGAEDGFVVVYQAVWEAMVSRVGREGEGDGTYSQRPWRESGTSLSF